MRMILIRITDRCDRRCPHCVFKDQPQFDLELEVLEKYAQVLCAAGKIDHVKITGGEPTMHPRWAELAPIFRKLFDAGEIVVESNGGSFEGYEHFDQVYMTRYENNGERVDEAAKLFKGIFMPSPVIHYPDIPGNGKKCHRAILPLVANNRIYPCCAPPSLESPSMEIHRNWRELVGGLKLDCAKCRFSGRD